MPFKPICILIGIWMCFYAKIEAQDIHYSQFIYHYPSQNPIQSGFYNGNHRITANYRNQWQTVPVPYMSFSLFYDSKIKLKSNGDYIGAGIGFDYDRAGDSELSLSSLNIGLNYGLTLSKGHLIILGLSPNIGQRRLSDEKLKWGSQWTGDHYDKNRSPNENFNTTGDLFFDLSGGLAYQYSFTKRTRLMASAAIFHLLEPDQTFYGLSQNKIKLPQRNVLNGSINLGLGTYLDLLLNGEFQKQDAYEEKLGTGLIRFYINQKPGSKFNLLAGCGIRLDDAYFPMLGFEYNNWMISGSYDITTSDFKTATNSRGGPEIAVQYIFKGIEPIGLYKKCPIY